MELPNLSSLTLATATPGKEARTERSTAGNSNSSEIDYEIATSAPAAAPPAARRT